MKELSLFTGAGGGLLGSRLLGWRCIGAVEWEAYPCKLLEARQKDGHLDQFPIFNMDIRDFNRDIAPMYKGLVDVITAGFPCQPFSVAGKQLAADDDRNMWPATIDAVRIVKPRWVYLENTPGLFTTGYMGQVLSDLAQSGYDARWRVLSAAELGAPHRRNRVWIVAHAKSESLRAAGFTRQQKSVYAPNANSTNGHRRHKSIKDGRQQSAEALIRDVYPRSSLWAAEPRVLPVAHGVARRMDQVNAIGNGQVPAVAAAAWRLLTEDMCDE